MKNEFVKLCEIEEKIIIIRNQKILLDKDVAELYGVQTKRINEAIKNNQEKFPLNYVFILNNNELQCLRSKNSTANLSKTRTPPRAFTEKGLYMIATIIKSPKAIATTFAIIEAFSKIRELSNSLSKLSETDDEVKQKSFLQKSGEHFIDLLNFDNKQIGSETTIEINFAVVKFKHTVKRNSDK